MAIEHVLLLSDDADDTLEIEDDLADNLWTVKAGPVFGNRLQVDDRETIDFDFLGDTVLENNFGEDRFVVHPVELAGASLTVRSNDGGTNDALEIVGTSAADVVTLTADSVTVNGSLPVIFDGSGGGFAEIHVSTRAGDDELTVDVDAATPSDLIGIPITFDGGLGSDRLTVTGTPVTPVDELIYSPGPDVSAGRLRYEDAADAALMTIDFTGLEPVVDLVPAATLTVNGTNAENAINYSQSEINPAWGKVSVDGFEPVHFANKATLLIDGLAGSDTVNLNNPATPTGLTGIAVQGGDPTAGSDTVIVNGTGAADAITVRYGNLSLVPTPTPEISDEARIEGAQPVPVEVDGVESLVINGRLGGDTLAVTGEPGGPAVHTFNYTPGDARDSASVLANTPAGDPLLPLRFQQLGVGGPVTLGPATFLVYNGTAANDVFNVAADGSVTVNSTPGEYLTVTPDLITHLRLNGLAGDDTFNIDSPQPYQTVLVNGGEPGGSDVLNLTGTAAADDVAVSFFSPLEPPGFPVLPGGFPVPATITGLGPNPIGIVGVENVNLDGNGGADTLTVNGSALDDVITYTPTNTDGTPDEGIFSSADLETVFTFNQIAGAFTIAGGPADLADAVIVRGTNNHDLITIDSPNRTVTVENAAGVSLKPVVLADTIETLTAEGRLGNDTFLVIPAPGVGPNPLANLLINVDGGQPGASDALVIAEAGGAALAETDFVVVRKGLTPGEGVVRVYRDATGVVDDEPVAATPPVQFPDIAYTATEIVSPNVSDHPDTGRPNLLILGADEFEENETLVNAAFLGSGATINVDNLSIFPDALEHPFVPSDQDWFRVVAQHTGTLDFQVYFEQYDDELLPAGGNLNIEVYDVDGQPLPIAGFGANDTTDDERVRIPAVAGQTYYLRVFGAVDALDTNGFDGAASLAANAYELTVINTPAPVPYDLELADLVLAETVQAAPAPTPTSFAGSAALPAIDDFFNGKYVEFTSGARIGERALVLDYESATRTFTVQAGDLSGAPAPGDEFQIESFDTGRSQLDDITRDNTPILRFRLDDGLLRFDLPGNDPTDPAAVPGRGLGNNPPDETIPIPFDPAQTRDPALSGFRIAIFDEGTPQQPNTEPQIPIGFARFIADGVYEFDFERDALDPDNPNGPTTAFALTDGSHFLSARVQMIDPTDLDNLAATFDPVVGWGGRSLPLEVVVDTQDPPVFFGSPDNDFDGLQSDTGVISNPDTFADRITSDTTPTFWGTAEADAVIRVYGDLNGNGQADAEDILLGLTVAVPLDGTNQFPNGQWRVESVIDLNDPDLFPDPDGLRTILVTAEDVAGNLSDAELLEVFIDTQGPQVFDPDGPGGAVQAIQVKTRNDAGVLVENPTFDLFDIKPTAGPTPRVDGLTINIRDLPPRVDPDFLFRAIKEDVAGAPGNIMLVGDTVGNVAIKSVMVVNDPPVGGEPATATIMLEFFEPLEDDRFTLMIMASGVVDLAGNPLDGESNAKEPNDGPTFPTGDGVPGGDFLARFTVDTRTEIGVWGQQGIIVDANGNFLADPAVRGGVHYDISRDLAFHIGVQSDTIFAGQFRPAGAAFANGYDRIGAYGKVGGAFRFLLDLNDNGRIDPGETFASAPVNGTPVAGNFDGNPNNGDEVGLFAGTNWFLDTNHSNAIELGVDLVVSGDLRGLPFVGDFDGDGFDDLATHIASTNTFFFSLSSAGGSFVNGNSNATHSFTFELPGVKERPFAGDFDGFSNDQGFGNEDFGIMVPNQQGGTGQAEFYVFRSGDARGLAAFENRLATPFTPTPLGFDIHTAYGHDLGAVVVGNFDPPSGLTSTPAFAQVGTSSDTTPKVEWSPVGGTLYYEVHLYHVDRGQMVYVVGIPETGYTHPQSLAPGRYESFVRARNSHGDPGSWTKMEFTVQAQALGVPVLTAPAANGQVTGGPVTISWNAAGGATGYQLLVYNTALGREVVNASVSGTSHTVSLPGGATYQVFVRATGAGQASGWSSPRVFEAAGGLSLPAKPDFLAPTLGGTTTTLSWTAASGADAYQIVVYDMALGREIVNTTVASATSHTIATTPGRRYQVFVRGTNTAGSSGWSGPQEFVAEAEGGEWSSGGVVSGEWIADYGLAIADYDQSAIRNLKSAMGPVTTHDSPLTSALDAVLAAWPEAEWWSEEAEAVEDAPAEEAEAFAGRPNWLERFGLAGGLFGLAAVRLAWRKRMRKQMQPYEA